MFWTILVRGILITIKKHMERVIEWQQRQIIVLQGENDNVNYFEPYHNNVRLGRMEMINP